MNKLEKIAIITTIILCIFTIIEKTINYENYQTILSIIASTIFNIVFLYVFLFVITLINKHAKAKIIKLLIIIPMVAGTLWYIASIMLKTYQKSFLSLSGFLFWISSMSQAHQIIFYLSTSIVIITISMFTFHKTINDKEHLKKTSSYFIISLILIILIVFTLPHKFVEQINPTTEYLVNGFLDVPKPNGNFHELNNTEKVLNISTNLKNPNIIFIVMDSVSSEHIGYSGYSRNITPTIDWFAENGIIFKNTYASAAQSDLSQTSFLSSLYPLKNKNRDFFTKDYPREFIWDILKPQGYQTAYLTSQNDEFLNMKQFYNMTNLDLYSDATTDNKTDYGSDLLKCDYDDKTLNTSLNWLDKKQKFFLYLNFQSTHYPYEIPKNNSIFLPDIISKNSNLLKISPEDINASINKYDNALLFTNKLINQLKKYLEKNNLLNNTIIVITADHGEAIEKTHEQIRHGYGLYEEQVKVPLIFFVPNQEPQIINDRVKQLDVIPTILKILNFSSPNLFQGKEMTKNDNIFLMVQNQYLQIGLIKDDIKYILDLHDYEAEAYNLTKDSKELNNLINKTTKEFYANEYGNILSKWYYCQLNYYNKEYKENQTINC